MKAKPSPEKPAEAPASFRVEQQPTNIVRQALSDYISSLPPAAREMSTLYLSQIIGRVVVLAE